MCTIIYGQFSAKATAKDITKHLSPRKPKLCARKNRESTSRKLIRIRTKSLPGFRRRSFVCLESRCINTRMYVHVCTILFLMSCSSPRGFHSPAIKGNPFAWGQGLEDQVSLNWYGMAQVTFQTGSRKATASNP